MLEMRLITRDMADQRDRTYQARSRTSVKLDSKSTCSEMSFGSGFSHLGETGTLDVLGLLANVKTNLAFHATRSTITTSPTSTTSTGIDASGWLWLFADAENTGAP